MGIFSQLIPLVKPLTILIGPVPLFYVYRYWKSTPKIIQRQNRRPLTKSASLSIILLATASFVYLCIALFGGSENVYSLTQARYVTSINVIQTRLQRIRRLKAEDHVLLERLATSLSERLNYATYGPKPLTECTWCLSLHTQPNSQPVMLGESTMYLLYSLPGIIAPYLFHAFILGITTTPFLAPSLLTRDLRIYFSYALGLTLAAELWILVTFDGTVNSSATEFRDVSWLHWDLQYFRYTMLCMISGIHAVLVYVIETGLLVLPATSEDRLLQLGIITGTVGARMRLTRTIRAVVLQNSDWREKMEGWWTKKRVENVEIPVEIREKWEGEARNWVDGMIQVKEE